MTSRQRVLASIEHKQPDSLALDLGSTPSSGISAVAYHNLKKYLGISEGHIRVFDVVQQVAIAEPCILDRYGVDTVDVGTAFNTEDADWKDVTLMDGQHVQFPAWFDYHETDRGWEYIDSDGDRIARMPQGANFFDQTYFPYIDGYLDDLSDLSSAQSKVLWQALAHSPWDHAGEVDFYKTLRAKAIKLRSETDRALVFTCGCNLFEWGTFLRRIDNFLMDLYTDEINVEKLLDALLESHLQTLKKVCESVGDICDIIRFGDDLGMDSGPFMSPEIYAKLFKPRHAKLNEYTKKHSNMKTFLHSCGSIYKLMPHLIEAGFDIINPVQTTCRDMEPVRLKKEFGSDITFWGGGCNTRSILNRAAPDEVYSYSRKMIDIFFKDGGFVFNQEHNILPDVPPENIEAMMRAVACYK